MKWIQPSQIVSFLSKSPIHLALLPLFFAFYTWKQCPHFFQWDQAFLLIVCCTAGLICLSGILYMLLFRKWSSLQDSLSNLDTYRIVLDKILRKDSLPAPYFPTEK